MADLFVHAASVFLGFFIYAALVVATDGRINSSHGKTKSP